MCILVRIQDLKGADIEQLESWVQEARKNKTGALNAVEHSLLNKYCAIGVSVSIIFSPFSAHCSKLLLYHSFSAILV